MRVPVRYFSVLVSLLLVPFSNLFPTIIINEIMNDPAAVSDTHGEWFELHNPDGVTVDLGGWTIRDRGNDVHQIPADDSLAVPPGGYVVLGRNGDPAVNGGYSVDYVYNGITLSNGEDEILLFDGDGVMVDSVAYGGSNWPSTPGASMEFIVGRAANDVGENWLSSTVPYGDGDLGTPGAENSATGLGIGPDEAGGEQEPDSGLPVFRAVPNPFHGSTTIVLNAPVLEGDRYRPTVQAGSILTVRVYDLRGRKIRDLWEGDPAFGSRIVWDGRDDRGVDLPPGPYIVRLTGNETVCQQKVVFAGK